MAMADNSDNARVRNWVDSPSRPARKPAVREVIPAGYTHAADGPYPQRGAWGFEAGGPADLMAPCAVLASLTGQVLEAGADRLTDDELVGVMRAARRVVSWQQAVELAAVAELTARRVAEPVNPGPRPEEQASAEIAVALTLTARSAELLTDLAAGVQRLESVETALRQGEIDIAKASVFVEELAGLDELHASVVASRNRMFAPDLTTGQLRQLLRRAVLAVDPEAVRRRQQKARQDARVESWSEGSGNGAIAGRELPPARTHLADRHVRALAKALQRAGMPGTLDQICAEVFLALLSGQSPESLLAAAQPQSAQPQSAQPQSAQPQSAQPQSAQPQSAQPQSAQPRQSSDDSAPDSATANEPEQSITRELDDSGSVGSCLSWPRGPLGTIHLTMPMSAWLGLTNNPGEIGGRGALDAWSCREIASWLIGRPGSRYCLTVTNPDGHPVGHACTRAPPPGLAPTEPGPPQGSPAPLDLGAWISGLNVNWLESGSCSHARETTGYVPGRLLGHLIKVRNPTCTAPGCRRPAQQCDVDHIVPYQQGGRTCECNLHPACRRHHRCKGSAGWRVEMPEPGVLVWRLPHGRSYLSRAQPYPV
ncbi:MAG: DUF222 domain-containing protein [Actinobacteria bacterium]|nr:DUF222 domain-containing protein [Actinomycetota bacterium]